MNKQEFKKTVIDDNNIENKLFFDQVSSIIQMDRAIIVGSYNKYGKENVCDLDLNEIYMKPKDKFIYFFNNYIDKLIKNKKKYHFITSHFNEDHSILKKIYNTLGYMNGKFEIQHDNIDMINNDMMKLPIELKNELLVYIDNYKNNKSTDMFIKLLMFIHSKKTPHWTLKDLKKGSIEYYDQVFKISDLNFSYFHIDIMYENFKVSNNIKLDKDKNDKYITIPIHYIYSDNMIFYYFLIKKFLFFIKWLYYNRLIRDKFLYKNAISLYNKIFDFRNQIGKIYNKTCLVQYKIYMIKIKIKKYKKKLNKDNNNIRYLHKIEKYNKKLNYITIYYNKNMKEINMISKIKYYEYIKGYSGYLNKYIRIK